MCAFARVNLIQCSINYILYKLFSKICNKHSYVKKQIFCYIKSTFLLENKNSNTQDIKGATFTTYSVETTIWIHDNQTSKLYVRMFWLFEFMSTKLQK